MSTVASANRGNITTISTASRRLFTASNALRPHPFTTLPVEIINEIFLRCLPDDEAESTPSPNTAPLVLCHVSSFWRKAALADPRLWRRLALNPKQLQRLTSLDPLCTATTRMVEQSSLWLKNIKDLGLDITVNVPISFWDWDVSNTEFVLPTPAQVSERWDAFIVPILVEQASRFRTLRLSFGVASLLESFFFESEVHPHPPFTRLESLTIKGDHLRLMADDQGASGDWAFKRFTAAPRLEKVALLVKNRIPFPLQLPRDVLPWAQLTHLMISMPCSGFFWKHVLPQCVRLEAGYINIEQSVAPDSVLDLESPLPVAGYIDLPRLHTFDVTFHDEFTSAYFDDFRFPALTKLMVACDFGSGFPTFQWLPPTQNVHFFMELRHLTSLTLSYQNMTEVELMCLLKHTVLLEDLVLDSYIVDHKKFLQALVVKPDSFYPPKGSTESKAMVGGDLERQPLLPKLQMFRFFLEYFADVPPTTFDEEDFLAVMTSRSEVAREVANNIPEHPQPPGRSEENGRDEMTTDTDSFISDSEMETEDETEDDDDEEDEVDDEMDEEAPKVDSSDIIIPPPSIPPTPTTPIANLLPFDPLPAEVVHGPPPAPTASRPKLPPISKRILPIRTVELSTDAREQSKFRRLECFEAGVERYYKETPTTPNFAFKLEFSSPSNWSLHGGEPVWF